MNYLRDELGVTFHFSTLVRDVEQNRVHTSAGSCRAEQIIVCSGHDYLTLLAGQIAPLQPSVCRLQMLRARPAVDIGLQHAVLTGLSCVHYGAFSDLPEAEAIRGQIEQHTPNWNSTASTCWSAPRPMAS